jgi:hypothetical protein
MSGRPKRESFSASALPLARSRQGETATAPHWPYSWKDRKGNRYGYPNRKPSGKREAPFSHGVRGKPTLRNPWPL